MPKIDPTTGCAVMTLGEFWQAEGQREGRDPVDLQVEFYAEMDTERQAQEDSYRDPALALEIIRAAYNTEEDPLVPPPVEVTEVTDVTVNNGMRTSGSNLTAKVRCEDGNIRTFKFTAWSDSGTMLDPPDGDEELEYEQLPCDFERRASEFHNPAKALEFLLEGYFCNPSARGVQEPASVICVEEVRVTDLLTHVRAECLCQDGRVRTISRIRQIGNHQFTVSE